MRSVGATLGTAVVLAFAGCGDSAPTKAEYAEELRSTMGELESAYGDAFAGATGGGDAAGGAEPAAADPEQLRGARAALGDAAERLEDITPPEGLGPEHEQLVSAVRDMASDVDLLVEAAELAETDTARARELTREFAESDAFGRVSDAASRLDEAGVDAGL